MGRENRYGATLSKLRARASRLRAQSGRAGVLATVVLLSMSVGLGGCGSASDHSAIDSARAVSSAVSEKQSLEENTRRELEYLRSASGPTLASIRVPGEDVITIAAVRCRTTGVNCYELAEYWEEPARYAGARHGARRGSARRFVGNGPAISDAGPATSALDLFVHYGCGGVRPHEHRYALAYGLLRGGTDTVTDRANGRRITLRKARIPASVHPEGVLVYGLLLFGPNEIIVRTPSGQIVERETVAGPNEKIVCHRIKER